MAGVARAGRPVDLVVALALTVGIETGFDSPLFAVSAVLAMIVMYDATGVRQAAADALCQVGDARAVEALVSTALSDRDEKVRQADVVIDNSGTEAKTKAQVRRAWKRIPLS